MSLDIVKLRKGVRKPTGMEEGDTDLIDDEIDDYLNRSFWEIQDKFPFREKEKTIRFATVIGTRSYDMPKPYDALVSLSLMDPYSSEFGKLARMSTDEYESVYIEKDYERGAPTHYTRENCFVRLFPTPDKEYTISMKRLITLEDLSNIKTTLDIPRVWHEIVMYGAVWRLFLDFGDISRSNHFKAHQVSLINSTIPTESKEEEDSREAGVIAYRPEYRV